MGVAVCGLKFLQENDCWVADSQILIIVGFTWIERTKWSYGIGRTFGKMKYFTLKRTTYINLQLANEEYMFFYFKGGKGNRGSKGGGGGRGEKVIFPS